MKTRASIKGLNRVGNFRSVSFLVVMLVVFVSALAYGADRLVVKDDLGETKFIVTQDGKVGVGTSTPAQDLEVVAPNNGLLLLSNTIADSTTKASRMVLRHYSNAQLPVYLFGAASTSTNNFVAFGGGNTMGNAATQIDLFTAPNTTTPAGNVRLTIKGNGYVGIGTQSPSYPLQMAGGAYSDGVNWINGSSREYKDNIRELTKEEAERAVEGLNPVAFTYKAGEGEQHIGFIAEDVPELVATKNRKGLSPMDIVAVLTKVVQEQQKVVQAQQRTLQEQQKTISTLKEELNEVKGKVR